jgi:hypothetical protein
LEQNAHASDGTFCGCQIDLNGLGKRLLSVLGGRNKMMAFMSKLSPLEMQATMNEKMMQKAINKYKI